jgi:hypothetical protein
MITTLIRIQKSIVRLLLYDAISLKLNQFYECHALNQIDFTSHALLQKCKCDSQKWREVSFNYFILKYKCERFSVNKISESNVLN